MKNRHQSYDVVLLPPDEISQEAIRLSQLIAKKFPVEFKLDGKTKYPHISLYHLEIPNENMSETVRRLKNIFRKQLKVSLKTKDYSYHDIFISWNFIRNQFIYELHRELINHLNELRKGLEVEVFKKLKFLTPYNYQEIRRFGSPFVLKNFQPHITITAVKRTIDTEKAFKTLPVKKTQNIDFTKASLGRLSDNGTVTEIIEEFNLY